MLFRHVQFAFLLLVIGTLIITWAGSTVLLGPGQLWGLLRLKSLLGLYRALLFHHRGVLFKNCLDIHALFLNHSVRGADLLSFLTENENFLAISDKLKLMCDKDHNFVLQVAHDAFAENSIGYLGVNRT